MCTTSVLAVVLACIGFAPPAGAATMTDDYGVILDDGSGSWGVTANDGEPDPDGVDYVEVTSGPDTSCSWICGSGTRIYVDASSAPSPPSGILSIGYDLIDGDTFDVIGSAHLELAVVPDHLELTSGNGEMTVSWPGLPAGIGGVNITYDTHYVSDHGSGSHHFSTSGTASKTFTGLTNGTAYYVYATPFYHGVDLEAGCGGYPCGLTGQVTPRAGNNPPVAVDDTVSLVDSGPKTFFPADNDTDGDSDSLDITGHTTPAHGTATCDTSSCEYTPAGAPVDDTFDYTVSDGYGGTDTGTIHLVARNATAANDTAATFVDEPVSVDVLANDTGTRSDDYVDLDAPAGVDAYWDDELRQAVITGSTTGTFTVPYTLYDTDGDELASAHVTVTVGAARPLFASDDSGESTELDVPVDIFPSDNDHILAAGFPLSNAGTSITVQPTHGTAVLTFSPQYYYGPNGEGTGSLQNLPEIHYTPNPHFLGTDHLTYQLTDAQGHTDTAVVTIAVEVPGIYFVDATPGIGSADLDFFFSSSPAVDDVMACYTVGSDRTTVPAAPTDRTACAHEIALPAGTPTSYHWNGLTNDVYYSVSIWVHSDDGTPGGVWSDPRHHSFRPGVRPVTDLKGDGGASNLQLSWSNPSAPQDSTGTTVRYSTTAQPATPTDGAGVRVGPGLTSASVTGLPPGTYYVSVFSTNTGTYGDPRTVTLKVEAGNHAPVATADTITLDQNSFGSAAVLANDTDADADPLDLKSYTQPAHGSVDCFGDSASGNDWVCRYEPIVNYYGTDTFTYVAWDHRFGESTATVNVTVNQINTAPYASDDSMIATTAKSTPVDLTQDAGDLEDDTLTYTIVTPPAHGTLTCPAPNTGLCSYTSAAAYTGPDSFVWKATDDGTNPPNLSSANATMSITVVANQSPTVSDQQVSANNGVAKTFSIATGASDPDGDTLTFSKVSDPQKGAVTCTTAGSCTYTAAGDASGQDSFNFQASDGHGGTAAGSVLIDITHTNRAPVAGDTTAATTNATPLVTNVGSLSADPDGDALSYSLVSGPTGTNAGTVSCSGSSCTYTPSASFTGTTSYTYQASDGALTDNGVVTINVTQANRAPSAVNDSGTAQPAQQITINVKANDSDPDGDPLTFALNNQAVHGTASCTAGGSCTYQSTAGYTGQDQFTYTVSDDHGHSAGATVTINVSNLNHAPVANDATRATDNGGPFTIDLTALTTDADAGDQLTWTKVDGPTPASSGALACTSAGQCTFTPASGFTGQMTFHYKANDGHADSNTATVTVNVAQANRAPHAVDDAATTRVDTPVTVDVLANDTDADDNPLTFTKVTDPAHGSVSCSTTPCVYTPSSGFAGSDSFTYKANDGTADSNVATVHITVVANRAPVATSDSLTTTANRAASVDVGSNDTDADGDTLTYAKGTDGAHGTVTCTGAGSCTYTPVTGYVGSDSFTYTVNDGLGGAATGTVSVSVTALHFVFSAPPKVTGTAKVGKTLTAKKGTFTPSAAKVTYTWLRNGKAIKGAKSAKYKLTKKDRGKHISVKLTYKAPATVTLSKTVKVTKRIA
jgi:hypothetical protein